jgi:NAD/NADP transhydrogenase alpha subunit
MASHAIRSRRRPVRAAALVANSSSKSSLAAGISRIALSRPARVAYVVLGTAGLAAIAVALIGPKRLEREVFRPLRGAIEPQAEKLWADSQPLREQIAGLFKSASPTGRERLVRSFQSWIGHFHAT